MPELNLIPYADSSGYTLVATLGDNITTIELDIQKVNLIFNCLQDIINLPQQNILTPYEQNNTIN